MKTILKKLIKAYQKYYSSFRPATCRYLPTCSDYALQALDKYGAIKGSFLAIKRILRCSPLTKHKGFYDPLP